MKCSREFKSCWTGGNDCIIYKTASSFLCVVWDLYGDAFIISKLVLFLADKVQLEQSKSATGSKLVKHSFTDANVSINI